MDKVVGYRVTAEPRGVTRREIGWRAAEVLVSPRTRPLPRAVDAALLALLAVFVLAGMPVAPFAPAEGAQLSLTRDADAALTDPAALLPGAAATPAALTDDALRLAHGGLTRYAAAAGWYAAGGRAADLPAVPGPPPAQPLLEAGRWGPALIATIAVLAMFTLAGRVAGRRVAVVATVLLALHPATLLAARQIGDNGIALALGLCTAAHAARISARIADGEQLPIGSWAGLAALAGLTLAAGPGVLPLLAAVPAWLIAGIAQSVRRQRRAAAAGLAAPPRSRPGAGIVLAVVGALSTWVAVSPSLWGWLPERLSSRAAVREQLVTGGVLPDPGAPGPGAALRDLLLGPFLDRPDGVGGHGSDGWFWSGLPVGGGAAPFGVLLALCALLGLTALVRVAAGFGLPPADADPGPRPRLASGHIGRRDALALVLWAAALATWFLAHPTDVAGDRLALLPFAAIATGLSLVVGVRVLVAGWRTAGRRALQRARSGAADQFGDDGGREPDEWQPAAGV